MHRSDPKRAFLVQRQISELGPEDAHRVFQQRLKYRLQFTGRRSDDFENLSAREQLLQGLVPLPDESREATTHGMAAPFDRCTAYFGAPFHTRTLVCGQTIVVRLAGTLEAGPGIPRSEYMRRRLMSESGHSRHSRHLSVSGSPQERTFGQCFPHEKKPAFRGLFCNRLDSW